MRADQLTLSDHLFISPAGAMLPAWSEAFAGARAIATGAIAAAPVSATVVWLRLESDSALTELVAGVHARLGPVPVVILSDTPNEAEALAALSAQARGYCNSHAGAEVLVKVASVVSQGGLWIGEALMQRILAVQHLIHVPPTAALPDWRATLTAREVQDAVHAKFGIELEPEPRII